MKYISKVPFWIHLAAVIATEASSAFSLAYAQDFENITNETFQTNFRPGHTISVIGSLQRSTWNVSDATLVQNVSKVSYLPSILVRYGYHINIRKKFGFIVGTSTGGYFETTNISGFKPKSSVLFPSLGAGFVHWPETKLRFTVFGEYSALWYPGMAVETSSKTTGDEAKSIDISSIADAALISVTADWYIWNRSGVGVIFGWRFVSDGFIGDSGSSREGNVAFKNNGFWSGLTYSLQLGEQNL
jgi:hypothetical protein